jgi:hypothetical protein
MIGHTTAGGGWRLADALAARRIGVPMMSPRRQLIAESVSDTDAVMALALVVARLAGQRNIAIRDLDACRSMNDASNISVHAGPDTLRFDLRDDITLAELRSQVATAGANCASACAEVAISRSARMAHQALAAEDAPLAVLLLEAGSCVLLTAPERLDALASGSLYAAIGQAVRVVSGAPECRLGAVSVLSACARANLLCRFQNGQRSVQPPSLFGRLAQLVDGNPSAILLRQGQRGIDAAEIWQRTQLAAAALRARGIGSGSRVALIGPRSIDHVLALLAVLRTGADALVFGARGSNHGMTEVDFVVVHDDAQWTVPGPEVIDFATLDHAGLVLQGADGESEDSAVGHVVCAAMACPVVLSADALMHSIQGVSEQFVVGHSVLWWSLPGHPAALLEILAPLVHGGCCVIPLSSAGSLDVLAETLRCQPVDVAMLPGGLIERAQRLDAGMFSGLRELLVRDDLPAKVLRRLQQALPRLRLAGIHGGDGCPLAAVVDIPRPLPAEWRRIPVGLPVAGVRIHVLAPDGGLLPVGVVGELHIGGCGVAVAEAGDDRSLVISRRFVCDPYGSPGQRLFRTGEHGRRLPDGCIERVDRHRPPLAMPASSYPEQIITKEVWLARPEGDQQVMEIPG